MCCSYIATLCIATATNNKNKLLTITVTDFGYQSTVRSEANIAMHAYIYLCKRPIDPYLVIHT